MMRSRLRCLAVLLACVSPAAQGAEPRPPEKPLFPVALGFKFPKARESFEEVKDLILKNYYSPEIDEDTLYWAATLGMLRRISPPDNPELGTLWAEKEYEKVQNALEGKQVSLGIRGPFNSADGSLTVTEVLPGSGAEKVILPLDRILRFDGESLKGRTPEEAEAVMSGPEGTTMTLTVNRDLKIFDVKLKRMKFAERNLVVTPVTEDAALMEVKRFSVGISSEIAAALQGLDARKFKSLVLDLRNNPGGVFLEAARVCELFLPEKSVLLRASTRDNKLQDYVSANTHPSRLRVAVLANRSSTSAAELVAGALREQNVAFIVGARTQGKGVYETTYALKNGFKVKFITGAMFTPAGNAWQGRGILPDFLVDQDDKTLAELSRLAPKERASRDDAILTALKILSLVPGRPR